jgi:hypothetical protein
MTATYEKNDFLAFGPGCWGRAKDAKEALRIARANFPFDAAAKKKATFTVLQLADQVDAIRIDESSLRFYSSKEPSKDAGLNGPEYSRKVEV